MNWLRLWEPTYIAMYSEIWYYGKWKKDLELTRSSVSRLRRWPGYIMLKALQTGQSVRGFFCCLSLNHFCKSKEQSAQTGLTLVPIQSWPRLGSFPFLSLECLWISNTFIGITTLLKFLASPPQLLTIIYYTGILILIKLLCTISPKIVS